MVVGDWYTIGILVGLGTALGVAATAVARRALVGLVVAAVVAVAIGFVFGQWDEAVGGLAGAVCGALGSAPLVAGALRRGGTRGGTSILLGARRARRGRARVRSRGRLPRGGRGADPRSAPAPPLARHARGSAHARAGLRRGAETRRPGRDRRSHAVDVRERRRPRASLPRRARRVPPRRIDLPVAHAGLPLVDRDGRASRRAPHPSSRLVESRRAAHRRVRLVVRRGSRSRSRAFAARHDHRPEPASPLEGRRDGLRSARGRRPDDGGDQHHVLPRPHPPPADDPRRARRLRAQAVLLVLALRERPHRLADRRAQPRARLDRRLCRIGRPVARHPRRLRPARLLPARLRLRLARGRARTARTRRSRAATPRSPC